LPLGDLVDSALPAHRFGGSVSTVPLDHCGTETGQTIFRGKGGPHGTVGVSDIPQESLDGLISDQGHVHAKGHNGHGILVDVGRGGVSGPYGGTIGGGDREDARDGVCLTWKHVTDLIVDGVHFKVVV